MGLWLSLNFLGHGLVGLVVLGSVIVPHYFCILLQTQKAAVQKRGGPRSEDPDSVKLSELLWRVQGSR